MILSGATLLAFRSRRGNEVQDTEELETLKSNERMEVQLTLQISRKEHAVFYGNNIAVVL